MCNLDISRFGRLHLLPCINDVKIVVLLCLFQQCAMNKEYYYLKVKNFCEIEIVFYKIYYLMY